MRIAVLAHPENLHVWPDNEFALDLDPGIHIIVVLIRIAFELVEFAQITLLCFCGDWPVEVVAGAIDD